MGKKIQRVRENSKRNAVSNAIGLIDGSWTRDEMVEQFREIANQYNRSDEARQASCDSRLFDVDYVLSTIEKDPELKADLMLAKEFANKQRAVIKEPNLAVRAFKLVCLLPKAIQSVNLEERVYNKVYAPK